MLLALTYLAIGLGLLTFGADILVRGASALALRLGMTPLLVGLTVVAFGTSAPEMVASMAAAFEGSTDMALGNVVGSNISNIALVLGLGALIRPISIQRQIILRDAPLAFAVSVLLALLLADGSLNRLEGVLLFMGIIGFTSWCVYDARRHSKNLPLSEDLPTDTAQTSPWIGILMTLGGLIGLAGGAKLFVDGAQIIARLYGVSEAIIGLTVMAVGTSLPEIATVAAASFRDMSDLITGNVIGSNIFNILSVLGASAAIFPLAMGGLTWIDISVFLILALLIWLMMARLRLSRRAGALLVLGYILYISYLF